MDFMKEIGILAIASRLKRISDQIMEEGSKFYKSLDFDFNPRWFPIALFLSKHPMTTIGEIAKALHLSHVAVSKTVQQMRSYNIVSLRKNQKDKRQTRVTPSGKGKKMLGDLELIWSDLRKTCSIVSSSTGFDTLLFLDKFEEALRQHCISEVATKLRKERIAADVKIIKYHRRYRDQFKALNLEWIEKYFSVEKVDDEVLSNPEKHILQRGGWIFLACIDKTIVGTCALKKMNGYRFELTKMAVAKEWQGYKIAQKLMEVCIKNAMDEGAKTLYLETNSKLIPANRLYRKIGFKDLKVGEKSIYARCNVFLELDLTKGYSFIRLQRGEA